MQATYLPHPNQVNLLEAVSDPKSDGEQWLTPHHTQLDHRGKGPAGI